MSLARNAHSSRTRSTDIPTLTRVTADRKAALRAKRLKRKMLPTRQYFDSTAFPHILERIIDLAPFDALLTFRAVNRSTRAHVDKLLWRHVAVGTPPGWDTCELAEPFPPWNRLPGAELAGPAFGGPHYPDDWPAEGEPLIDWEEEEARRTLIRQKWGVWNGIRVVDNFGAHECAQFDFPDAVVRYIWPCYGIGAARSLVAYLRVPQANSSNLPIDMAGSRAKSVVLRALVDVPELNASEEDHFSWAAYRFNYIPRDAVNLAMTTVAIVFEVIADGAERTVEEEALGGAIAGLDAAVAATLALGRKVIVAGLELIPLHALGFAPTTTREVVRERLLAAVTECTRTRLSFFAEEDPNATTPYPSLDEAMANFTLCSFEEWAATADPAEVTKPDIDPDFLGNPAHVGVPGAPSLPYMPACPSMEADSDFFDDDGLFSGDDMGFDYFGGDSIDDDAFDEEHWDWDDDDDDGFPGVIGVIGDF